MSQWVMVGRVSGLYGVSGWVKLFSHTEPRLNIVSYDPLYLNLGHDDSPYQAFPLSAGKAHGKGVIAKFAGIDDRDAAAALVGSDIAVRRDQLPPLGPGEYYWSDLEGLQVINRDGDSLGVVDHLFATGANDVLVTRNGRERLIPFLTDQVVLDIDLGQRRIRVDWDADF